METFIEEMLEDNNDHSAAAEALRERTPEELLAMDHKRADAVADVLYRRAGDNIDEYDLTPRQRELVEESLRKTQLEKLAKQFSVEWVEAHGKFPSHITARDLTHGGRGGGIGDWVHTSLSDLGYDCDAEIDDVNIVDYVIDAMSGHITDND